MNRLIYILAIIWVLILPSCSPNELPEDLVEEPEYSLEGTLDGQEFTLEVGPDNVFVTSDSDVVEDEVPTFIVEINGEECEECLGSLEFSISGSQEYAEGLEFLEFILQGNYNVIDPSTEEEVNLIEVIVDNNENDALLINNIEFSESYISLTPGIHTLSVGVSLDIFAGDINSYISEFYVGEEGDVCLEQSSISYQNDLLNVSIPESQEDFILSVTANGVEVGNSPLVSFNPNEFLIEADPAQILELIISYSDENECVLTESFIWVSQSSIDFNNYPSVSLNSVSVTPEVEPVTVSLSYTTLQDEVYTSVGLDQDWFEITSIDLAEENGNTIFNITFSCTIDLVNENDSSDVITLQLENAVIPLVFE